MNCWQVPPLYIHLPTRDCLLCTRRDIILVGLMALLLSMPLYDAMLQRNLKTVFKVETSTQPEWGGLIFNKSASFQRKGGQRPYPSFGTVDMMSGR